MHSMSTAAKLIICAVVIGVAAWPPLATPWSSSNFGAAFAQSKKATPKKAPRKKATPKQTDRGQVRTTFTAEDQAVAVIPGIPDARAWG